MLLRTARGRWVRLCLFALLALLPRVAMSDQTTIETGLLNGTAEINGRKMPYVVYVPRSYSPDTQVAGDPFPPRRRRSGQ